MSALLWTLSGCSLWGDAAPSSEPVPDRFARVQTKADATEDDEFAGALGGAAPPMDPEPSPAQLSAVLAEVAKPAVPASAPGAASEAAVREWFPEAFVWRPLVETGADGVAAVDLRVPDSLTTWRVLALAHDRSGQQTGSVHTFDSTLPAYVDPVVPGWQYVGDALVLPVQVQNNTADPLRGTLAARASEASSGDGSGPVALGAFGSAVRGVPIVAEGAGRAVFTASLPGVDAVRRTWPVHPTGRPVSTQRGGVLRGERSLSLAWPEGADPRTARVRIEVQPGPLGVLTTELERLVLARGDGAYGIGLSGRLRRVADTTGATLDEPALRGLRIRSWQRLVRAARSPDAARAVDLLLGLGSAPADPLAASLYDRLVRTVRDGQMGDGTWTRSTATLQSVVVSTALAMHVLPEGETGARVRAQGALERHRPAIEDPYTAAVVLATGGVARDAELEALLVEAVTEADGRRTIDPPAEVASAFGGRVSRAEMLAWSVLALDASHPELAGDLVAELMTLYGAERGFGAGPADALALDAVLAALPTAPSAIALAVQTERGTATAVVDPAQPGVPAVLELEGAVESLVLTAQPAAAGVTFVVDQRAWVPWRGSEGLPGIEVEVAQGELRAGREGTLTLTLAAPSGTAVSVVQGLPAGVSVDEHAVRSLPGVADARVDPDRLSVTTERFGAGEVLELTLPVAPTYAGRMTTRPLEVRAGGREALVAPHVWTVLR